MEPSLPALRVNGSVPAERHEQAASELIFLLQVSRPGLWSTTALFYLMPLGHADFLHSRTLGWGFSTYCFPWDFFCMA